MLKESKGTQLVSKYAPMIQNEAPNERYAKLRLGFRLPKLGNIESTVPLAPNPNNARLTIMNAK